MKLTKTDLFVFDGLMRRTVEGFNGMFERIPGTYKLFRTIMKILQYNEDKELSPRSRLYSLLGAGNDIALKQADLLVRLFMHPDQRDLRWLSALEELFDHINWALGPNGYGMLHFVRITETFEANLESRIVGPIEQPYYILSSRYSGRDTIDELLIEDLDASDMTHIGNKLFNRLDVKVEKIAMNYETLEKLFSSLLKKYNWERTENKMNPGHFYWKFKEKEVFERFFEESKDAHHN